MSNPETSLRARHGRRRQRGVSLVELLVGIFLGLLVIGAAISTLMVSRATSATIGDITQLQQQGSYAMRVMGMQFRQAGSIDIADDDTPELYLFKNNYTGLATTDRLNITGSDGTGTAADIVSVSNQPASGLTTAAQWLERVATSSGTYPGTAAFPDHLKKVESGGYDVSYASTDGNTYTLTATPKAAGTMAGDKCGAFTLTQTGERGLTGATSTVADCWGR